MQDRSLPSRSSEPSLAASLAFTPYKKRAFGSLGLWNEGEWAFKVYGINYQAEHAPGHLVNPTMVAAARTHIQAQLPDLNRRDDHHHTGFVIVHQALGENWLMLHWWIQEAICCEALWKSHEATPTEFGTAPKSFMACVWELVVIDFERRAWVDTMLRPDSDRDAYLATRLADGTY